MDFIRKNASEFQSGYTGYYLKPATCPHCGVGTDAVVTAREVFPFTGNANLLFASAKCTGCHRTFFFSCVRESGNSDAEVVSIYPNTADPFRNETLEKISPRFMNLYNQGIAAEKEGHIELAALGYCKALEILDYLQQRELINTPDLIRILGDEYTHYEKDYPEQDLVILKGYMEIFLKQIEMQYMIRHMTKD